jgi:hypothetical protein
VQAALLASARWDRNADADDRDLEDWRQKVIVQTL